jgi:UPF0755 protein
MRRPEKKRAKKGRRPSGGLAGRAKLALRLSAVALTLALLTAAAVQMHYRSYIKQPVLEQGQSHTLVIPRNTTWPEVVSILERSGLVERPSYFEYWARRRHLPAAVKAGTYELAGPMTLSELDDVLREGGLVEETEVTFPEGLTIFHMADRVDRAGLASRKEFLRAARDEELLAEAGIEADSFEGYLFPDTYRFRKGASVDEIIKRLNGRWQAVWMSLEGQFGEQMESLADEYGFDRHQFVTFASIVERETSLNEERDLIARVFYNRLDSDMRLQTDPTCVYGEETYDKVPTPQMCKDKLNRYSTYVIDGLPPGPIANPGRASLSAALNPSAKPEATRYLFFVARRDGTGRHHFSETYAEHRRAIRQFLK